MENQSGDGSQEPSESAHETHRPWPHDLAAQAEHLQEILKTAEAKGPEPPRPCESPSHKFAIAVEEQFIQNEKRAVDEDARLDYLLRMQKTLHETFDNGAWVHPHGMSDYDYCIIPECRHKGFEKFKMNIRRQNYIYLHQHPELDALMSIFIKKLLKAQPRDAVRFAAQFFTYRRVAPQDLLRLVDDEKLKLKQFQNPKGWKAFSEGYSQSVELKDVNEVKSLNLGPACQTFGFTPPPSPERKRSVKVKKIKVKPKPHVYCGCKDPGRRELAHPKLSPTKADVPPDPEPNEKEPELCLGLPTHETKSN